MAYLSASDTIIVTPYLYHKERYIPSTPYETWAHSRTDDQRKTVVHYMDGSLDYVHKRMMLVLNPSSSVNTVHAAAFRLECEDIGCRFDAELTIDDEHQTVHFRAISFTIPYALWTDEMWDKPQHPLQEVSFEGYHNDVLGIQEFFSKPIRQFVTTMFGKDWTYTLEGEDKRPSKETLHTIHSHLQCTHPEYDNIPTGNRIEYNYRFERLYTMQFMC